MRVVTVSYAAARIYVRARMIDMRVQPAGGLFMPSYTAEYEIRRARFWNIRRYIMHSLSDDLRTEEGSKFT